MTIMNRLMRATPVAAILAGTMGLAILTVPAATSAQSFGSGDTRVINDQMAQMQRELDVLQRHVYQGRPDEIAQAGPGGGNIAGLQLRLDEIDSRMRDMNGRMEELNHRVNQLNDRLDKFASDLDFRLSNTAPGSAAGASATAPPPPADAPLTLTPPPPSAGDPSRAPSVSGNLGTLPLGSSQSASVPPAGAPAAGAGMSVRSDQALPDGTPDEQYKYAFALLTQSDYPGAERALTAFLAAHPNHALAGNAQYWLGETYYVRNDFNEAARAFAIGFQKYPKNAKGPDNLLKLGLSLSQLNRTKEACQSYGMLRSEFPKAPQEVMRRAEAERKRLRCT